MRGNEQEDLRSRESARGPDFDGGGSAGVAGAGVEGSVRAGSGGPVATVELKVSTCKKGG